MDVVSYKCPACGAPLTFKSETQLFGCDYCESEYTLEALEELYKETTTESKTEPEKEHKWSHGDTDWREGEADGLVVYNCPSCGAQIFADKTTGATSCVYCGNTAIIPEQFSGAIRPDYVIPFKLNKQAAQEAFKNNCKGKRLLPKDFLTESRLESITGLYVPFWLYDCDIAAALQFKATKVSHWQDSQYRYTKTDTYAVYRRGFLGFNKIPVDGSSKMVDAYMDAVEPFDYSGLTEFNTAYLSGYLADKYDVDVEASKPRANERIKNSTIQTFEQTVSGYSSVTPVSSNIDMKHGDVRYALMPVWMLNSIYKGKRYAFAMNGQTGKFIGELPYSKGKFWAWLLGLSGVFCALALLAALMLG